MPFALLRDELLARGYTYGELKLDRVYKQYFSPNGKLAISKAKYYDYPFVSHVAKKISIDKTLSYNFVSQKGIAVPATLRTANTVEALEFLEKYKKVVVKPPHLGGGRGLTVDITDPKSLIQAIEKAIVGDVEPLIQQQFIGEEVRFTVIGGKVRSAILRQTPRVVGDGVSTVAHLVTEENKQREALVFPTLSYPQLNDANIPSRYFASTEVLGSGEVLEFSRATMIRNGASFYGIQEHLHPSYITLVEKLAATINPAFLVVDLMIKKWHEPVSPDSYIFLEFNTSPGLEVYTSLRGGDKPDVIRYIADQIDAFAQISN